VRVRTGKETDFWRETFYGFWRDNGHFLYRPVAGDFSAEVTVKGDYQVLYDQAGLMVRLSETHWIKAGIEYTDGLAYFSVVVTNDTSDWSLVSVPAGPDGVRIRLTRHAEAIRVQYLDVSDGHWKPVRLAYFPPSKSADVGMMCCSPQREGFEVTFADFSVGPPIARELHD
jgi:regulation of enolase protein 1 (concanavalin A-like superfamily)